MAAAHHTAIQNMNHSRATPAFREAASVSPKAFVSKPVSLNTHAAVAFTAVALVLISEIAVPLGGPAHSLTRG
jgi:hypothetical protein